MFYAMVLFLVSSLCAICISVAALSKKLADEKIILGLKEAQEENKRLEKALTLLIDDGATIELALPAADETISKQREEIKKARDQLRSLEEEKDSIQKTLLEVLDPEKKVLCQIKVPGKKVDPPNRTPCGRLCAHAYWWEDGCQKLWRCRAFQGYPVDTARKNFLDHDNQCVMFEKSQRDKNSQ